VADIVEGNDCGVCVDPAIRPRSPPRSTISAATPQRARRMGENGRRAVLARYNWHGEADKLAAFYDRLLLHAAPGARRRQAGGAAGGGTKHTTP
jgi:glycosyltransferase involved in cell wall biosynthesis